MFVGAEVVNPEFFGPGFFVGGGFAIEEEDVGFDSLGVEDAGGKAQEGDAVDEFDAEERSPLSITCPELLKIYRDDALDNEDKIWAAREICFGKPPSPGTAGLPPGFQ